MAEDIIKVFEEYREHMMFCRYFIANELNHKPEMGRCGEKILIDELKSRYEMLEFVSGFVVCDGVQSPQCDVLVCRKDMHRRRLDGDVFIVDPQDCLMIVEVKGNSTLEDLTETIEKNRFFAQNPKLSHIKLAMFSYRTRIGKKALFGQFGYKYSNTLKAYQQGFLPGVINLDIFICLHRESLYLDSGRDKQVFFIKDSADPKQYIKDDNYPVAQNFFLYIQSLHDRA